MYNLLVMPNDDCTYWEKNESQWILPCWSRARVPDRKDYDSLRYHPCLFTYELPYARPVVVGHIGKIVDMRYPEIKYQFDDKIEIRRDCLADLGFEIGVDNTRTRWTVKNVDLWEVVARSRKQTSNLHPPPSVTEMERVWGEGYLWKPRVFLSHKAAYHRNVSQVASRLESAGCTCFVAHEDIRPGAEWHDEIIRALETMEVFVGFITTDFHGGGWPDQEVGYAYCRGIPKVFLKLERSDPRGMVGGEQALTANWHDAGDKLVEHLRMREVILKPRQRELGPWR